MDKFMVRDQERIPGEGMLHNKMDLNTDADFMEVRKYKLSNQTLNTHKIITREMNPEVGAKKVRRWYDVDTKEVGRLKR